MAGFQFDNHLQVQSPENARRSPFASDTDESAFTRLNLRSTDEIPLKYRHVFDGIPYFNVVQSTVLDDVLYTDNPLVVCAPTGSGKTMIFELAIIRMLLKCDEYSRPHSEQKIIYMAPIKALCAQRHSEWGHKFESINLKCTQLTGDSNNDDLAELQKANIIFTTPEKWDSTTRRWHNNITLISQIKLFLIDEVHLLNDESRGATMEAVISRMKTNRSHISMKTGSNFNHALRFVAVSATIPNVIDIADWLGSIDLPATHFLLSNDLRPVKLNVVVLGYPCYTDSEFKFDVSLNYKLSNVIENYCENKPTLVFCSTRKSVEQAASRLACDSRFVVNEMHQRLLNQIANLVRCHKLRDCLMKGVAYHHAGLDFHDRELVEKGFIQGHILVLLSTSTLAMGVNLPAHLVIIKSTSHYIGGVCEEYSQSELMQMVGRAGRPQFDTTATAVIMTKQKNREKYQNITHGTKQIESSLHKHLIEHLNAEIVLGTIPDASLALEWIKSTFLYIRALRNPVHYGYSAGLSTAEIESHLQDLCISNLNALASENLVNINESFHPNVLQTTSTGRLMAQYCIAFETMKNFLRFQSSPTIEELTGLVSSCKEFQDINLRVSEKSVLNKLNKNKTSMTIRYPMESRIKTSQMKVNCLLQAVLGNLPLQEFALQQDMNKIFRIASRVSRCFMELQFQNTDFNSLLNAAKFSQCIKAKMWDDSPYVCKQLPGIGPVLATALVNGGIRNFEAVGKRNPRELELIVNRHPPFGNQLQDAVRYLPKYQVSIEEFGSRGFGSQTFRARVSIQNHYDLRRKQTIFGKHTSLLIIGDSNNNLHLKRKFTDSDLLRSEWSTNIEVKRMANDLELKLVLCSQEWAGLDVECTYKPFANRTTQSTSYDMEDNFNTDYKRSRYFGGNNNSMHGSYGIPVSNDDVLFDSFESIPSPSSEKKVCQKSTQKKNLKSKYTNKNASEKRYSSKNISNWMKEFSYKKSSSFVPSSSQCLWNNKPEFIDINDDELSENQDADSAISMYLEGLSEHENQRVTTKNKNSFESHFVNKRKSNETVNTNLVRKKLYFAPDAKNSSVDDFNIANAQPNFDLDWDDWDDGLKETVNEEKQSSSFDHEFSDDVLLTAEENSPIPVKRQLLSPTFSDISYDKLRQTPDDTPITSKASGKMYPSCSYISNQRSNTFTPTMKQTSSSSKENCFYRGKTSDNISEIPCTSSHKSVIEVCKSPFPKQKENCAPKSFFDDIFPAATKSNETFNPLVTSIKKADKKELEKAQQIYFSILDSFDL
ncbi:putative ATP-dependent DNA helicase HFM1 [Styela clava]